MGAPLIYGAYGYTGELVAREAVERGFEPILAGRRQAPLRELADELAVPFETATLDDLDAVLHSTEIEVVLHCAGPFLDTHEPVVEACLATGTHYVDITGEIPVYESVSTYETTARERDVLLLSGAGFDVVPSDCLAARLHEELPTADRLTLAFPGLDAVSGGTVRSVARILGDGVAIRENGQLKHVPFGSRTRTIDTGVGDGPQQMGIIPWGDAFTAYHTTGIPTIEIYAADVLGLSPAGQRLLGSLQPLLGIDPVRKGLARLAGRVVEGPTESERLAGSEYFWGEVTDGNRTVTGRVHTPESYQFTARAVVEIADRILGGDAPAGYQTPAGAYGPTLVTSIEGARFEAIDRPET